VRKLEDLVQRAKKLKEKGLTTGEIADELNISRETALWLLTQGDIAPADIYVSWRNVAKSGERIAHIASIMADMIEEISEPEVVIGVATSGVPLATFVAEELDCSLAIFYPKKLKWESEEEKRLEGIISENFARIDGRKCVVVDDVISTGRTIEDVATYAKKRDAEVECACVIVDKQGRDRIAGIPIMSVFRIIRL
jgi:orotate phosphoribosyltransferase